ncbi:hypothetical protein [Nostoc sp.]|uniref:hypothetical protein n=1 Tax=Nostoc sp. TaxID=1180 RepID=UPI002FF9E2EE
MGTLTLYLFSHNEMKKLISLAIVSGLLLGCNQSSSLNSIGSDNYEVSWDGTSGAKLWGSYVISSKSVGQVPRVEKITEKLPYKVNFSASKNALISAAGATLNQGTVEIKIFRNGVECGKVAVTGSGSMSSKICQ